MLLYFWGPNIYSRGPLLLPDGSRYLVAQMNSSMWSLRPIPQRGKSRTKGLVTQALMIVIPVIKTHMMAIGSFFVGNDTASQNPTIILT